MYPIPQAQSSHHLLTFLKSALRSFLLMGRFYSLYVIAEPFISSLNSFSHILKTTVTTSYKIYHISKVTIKIYRTRRCNIIINPHGVTAYNTIFGKKLISYFVTRIFKNTCSFTIHVTFAKQKDCYLNCFTDTETLLLTKLQKNVCSRCCLTLLFTPIR